MLRYPCPPDALIRYPAADWAYPSSTTLARSTARRKVARAAPVGVDSPNDPPVRLPDSLRRGVRSKLQGPESFVPAHVRPRGGRRILAFGLLAFTSGAVSPQAFIPGCV